MKIRTVLLMAGLILLLCACGLKNGEVADDQAKILQEEYEKIAPEEAYEIMEEEKEYILLDVRSEEEYAQEHIEGAILIPDTEMDDQMEKKVPDKDMVILVYCRTGRRSALAAESLCDMGYTNVYDFGGIQDWPYETVTG